MRKFITLLALTIASLTAADIRPLGVLQSVEDAGKKLVLKTDAGPVLQVVVDDTTKVLKVKPGETTLNGASPLQLSDLAAGDRILVRGTISEDQKSIPAKQIIVMTKSDVASKHAADQAEWTRRGIFGTVSAIDAAAKTITVNVRGGMPGQGVSKPVTVTLNEKTVLRRYAPDSIKFADAQPGTLTDVHTGDQLRARGEKSSDGSSITAEEIISGTFHNIAATILSIDPATQTMKVTDLDAKKPVLVKVNSDSSLKRMPPMFAQMIAMRLNGGTSPQGANAPPAGAARVGGGPGGMFGPGGPGGAPTGSPAQMFERMPAFKLDELKAGEALIISAPAGKTSGEVTATMIVAGVEPILTTPSKNRQVMLGNWNVDMTGGGAGMGMQ